MRHPLLNWLFYGHFWIALAALGLSWQSTYLATGGSSLGSPHYFVFFATLGVYTLHRSLSYRRAGSEPDGRRYRLVARNPLASIVLGFISLLVSLLIATKFPLSAFWPVIFALPFTLFYLIPIYPGGPRMRDLPYLKVIWVAMAWMLMTDSFPKSIEHVGTLFNGESYLRFALVLAVALLFDTRDVVLDRRQGVKTLAADYPSVNHSLALALLIACAAISVSIYPTGQAISLVASYLMGAAVAWKTKGERGEDFYATWVNGILLLPPFTLFILNLSLR